MQVWARMHTANRHGPLDRRISMAIQTLITNMTTMTCHRDVSTYLAYSRWQRSSARRHTRWSQLVVTACNNAANKLVAKISHQPARIMLLRAIWNFAVFIAPFLGQDGPLLLFASSILQMPRMVTAVLPILPRVRDLNLQLDHIPFLVS